MMDELTRRLRELMKPIANGPLLEVEGLPVPEGEKKAGGTRSGAPRASLRRYLSETAK